MVLGCSQKSGDTSGIHGKTQSCGSDAALLQQDFVRVRHGVPLSSPICGLRNLDLTSSPYHPPGSTIFRGKCLVISSFRGAVCDRMLLDAPRWDEKMRTECEPTPQKNLQYSTRSGIAARDYAAGVSRRLTSRPIAKPNARMPNTATEIEGSGIALKVRLSM